MEDVNWGVVKNGLDFLESSVEHLAQSQNRNLKYAALHLFASMETLVKARLAREHWTLVVADVNAIGKAAFRSGDFKSVTISQALQRLKAVSGFTLDDKAEKKIRDIEKLRNRAAHFSLQGETQQRVSVVVARGLDFTLRFIEEELRPAAPAREADMIDETLDRVRDELGKIQVLVKERMKSLEPAMRAYPFILSCPACRQPSLVLGDGEPARCLYCLYNPEGSVIAEEFATAFLDCSKYEHVKQGGEWPVFACLNCGEDALVEHVYSVDAEEIGWACFACGLSVSNLEMERCSVCNVPTDIGLDGMSLCADCASTRFHSD